MGNWPQICNSQFLLVFLSHLLKVGPWDKSGTGFFGPFSGMTNSLKQLRGFSHPLRLLSDILLFQSQGDHA